MSAEQWQICARNYPKIQKARRNVEHLDHVETMEIPGGPHTNEQQLGNLVQDYERRFEQLSDDQKLSKLCSDAGLRIVEKKDNTSSHLIHKKEFRMQHLCREYTMPRCEKEICREMMDSIQV